jgi:hypothetical protein
MLSNSYTIIPHPIEGKILIMPAGDEWTLPLFQPPSSWTPQIEVLVAAMQEQLSIRVVVQYCIHVTIERAGDVRSAQAIYAMQNLSPGWEPPAGARWVSEAEFDSLQLDPSLAWARPHILSWFAEERSGIVPPLRPPWGRKGWYEAIDEWARGELALMGIELLAPPTQLKQWDISSVLKAPTGSGDVYIKAIPTLFATEPRITSGLYDLFPAVVPRPLATYEHVDEGRLLLRDFGGKLFWLDDTPPHAMFDALTIFARMQIECVGKDDFLREIGCRDRTLAIMPAQMRELMADASALSGLTEDEQARFRALMPAIERACDQLASGPIPQTLMHGDLHGGNIARTGEGYVIFDWTDACISHPFFDLLTIIDNNSDTMPADRREQLISAYLSEWAARGYGSVEDLRATCDLALKLGPLYHAISYWQILKVCEQPTLAEMGGALPYYLKLERVMNIRNQVG